MDLFDRKDVQPMLIGESGAAFDSADYIYELKLDGVRCIAYLGDEKTELRNKRMLNVTATYPELSQLHEQVNARCILDGEVFVMRDGRPCFAEMQRRSIMSDKFKVALASKQLPASFTAFDILYRGGEELMGLPLSERKRILSETVTRESDRFAVSRCIELHGVALYNLTVEQGLEGVVAKRKSSRYFLGKRTKDWIKCKNLLDDDYVVCGYVPKPDHTSSIVIGQYNDAGVLQYKGHVALGVTSDDFARISGQPRSGCPFMRLPAGNNSAVWIDPSLVCAVRFMERHVSGSLRQPIFKGLRDDKLARECLEPISD